MTEGMGSPDVLVAGYASIDRAWRSDSPPAPGKTSILLGLDDPAPRFGGCGPNVALHLARLGRAVGLITWLGDDPDGRAYLDTLRAAGVDLAAVEVAAGCPSPRALLIYDPTGGATCLYHPGGAREQRLSPEARVVAGRARSLALTVCPAPLSEALLDVRVPGTYLAWNVKADGDAYPVSLRDRLVRDADLICLNRDELAFLGGDVRDGDDRAVRRALGNLGVTLDATVVLTLGVGGCLVRHGERIDAVPAERVAVRVDDPTGAGDAFFAAILDALLAGASRPDAARAAAHHAATFLETQVRGEGAGGS
jgi:sugar/nucleoside kinase (ribokinase family)